MTIPALLPPPWGNKSALISTDVPELRIIDQHLWKRVKERQRCLRKQIRGAPHSGLARLISRINCRISSGIFGLPQRGLDFQRQ